MMIMIPTSETQVDEIITHFLIYFIPYLSGPASSGTPLNIALNFMVLHINVCSTNLVALVLILGPV